MLLDRHSKCMCHCVDTGKAQNTLSYLQSVAPFLSAKKRWSLVRENQQSSAHNFVKDFSSIYPESRRRSPLKKGAVTEIPLEYGKAEIEIHKDAIKPGDKVVLVDDLIATGGTIQAAAKLVEELGGEVVKMIFLIELTDLGGRKLLEGYDVASVVQYEGE